MTQADIAPAETVTVIGLGDMGTALAEAFIKAGHKTTVWNRTASKAEALVSRGALRANSVADAVAASKMVVICISDYDAVKDALGSVPEFDRRTLVNMTTGGTAAARDLAAWIARRNGSYLDGAILAKTTEVGPDAAGSISISGPQDAWDEHRLTLAALGSGITYLGADPGLTGLFDLAALGVTWSVLNAFLHAVALFEAAGQKPDSMLAFLDTTLSAVAGWLPGFASQIETGDFPPDGDVYAQLAGINQFLDESAAAGISTDLPVFLKAMAERAVADGHGHEGYPSIISQFRRPSPPVSGLDA